MSFENVVKIDRNEIVVRHAVYSNDVILQDQVLSAGSVLGMVTATGKLKLVNSTSNDGSENIYGVLTSDLDTTGADQYADILIMGEVVENKLIFGDGDSTTNNRKVEAKNTSIIFRKNIKGE